MDGVGVSDAVRLVVDPVRCEGVGICAHAGGRVVDLDAWGYPVVPTSAVTGRDARAARAATRACPRRALSLLPVDGAVGQASGEPPVTPSTWAVT